MSMSKRILGTALVLSAILTAPAWSQDKPQAPASDTGVVVIGKEAGGDGGGVGVLRVRTATIKAIDPATRDVTLSQPKGPEVVIRASDAVKNFDQLKVGDRVTLTQGEALLLGLNRVTGGIRQRTDWVEVDVAPPGAMPGVVVRHRIRAVANVTAIDRKTGKVTLRGVRETRKFHIDDKQLLASLKVGDQVEATLLQGEALTVERAKAR